MSFLVISLDFELHWGIFDKVSVAEKKDYFKKTIAVIPQVLEVFERYEVAATWATVGMLLTESREEWEHYRPETIPTYRNQQLSPYQWIAQNAYDPAVHSGFSLVKQLLQTPNQELGSHTFSHYYTCEPGQQLEQFRSDLKVARRIAEEKCGVDLQSLVFPRNQFDQESLKICKDEGFSVVRVNPSNWFWKAPQHAGLVERVFRTVDTLLPLGKRTSFPLEAVLPGEDFPVQLPASRLLRPFSKTRKPLNVVRMNRVISEMTYAAKHNLVYHLWWHPHNFGHAPEESMLELCQLLDTFIKLKGQYGMCSVNMGQLAGELNVLRN
ncbi:polysaccharide deacetylase family protein [Echinicola soli]|uniref:Polysaccharide deacetylase family protein n=1 Tax=Echinicola soli TaxID=2591634 RepID=A0A514CJJ0_9BACT|nr:polysaccharide deacetylase family protein [Echinicola soli]QDH79814.1 polysaccharide deacetylase family protein [Echinicola soli]